MPRRSMRRLILLGLFAKVLMVYAAGCHSHCRCYIDADGYKTANCTTTAFGHVQQDTTIQSLNVRATHRLSSFKMVPLYQFYKNLVFINMSNCSVLSPPDGIFFGLNYIIEIDLSFNKIRHLNSGLFIHLSKLRTLVLRGNPLGSLSRNSIVSKSLQELDIGYCGLRGLQEGVFSSLPALTHLSLDGNNLTTLANHVLPKGLKYLNLAANKIINVPTDVLISLPHLRRLDISENPINCTCYLLGVQDWFSGRGISFENDVICSFPEEFVGQNLNRIDEYDFCKNEFTRERHINHIKYSTFPSRKAKRHKSNNFHENEFQADQPAPAETLFSNVETEAMGTHMEHKSIDDLMSREQSSTESDKAETVEETKEIEEETKTSIDDTESSLAVESNHEGETTYHSNKDFSYELEASGDRQNSAAEQLSKEEDFHRILEDEHVLPHDTGKAASEEEYFLQVDENITPEGTGESETFMEDLVTEENAALWDDSTPSTDYSAEPKHNESATDSTEISSSDIIEIDENLPHSNESETESTSESEIETLSVTEQSESAMMSNETDTWDLSSENDTEIESTNVDINYTTERSEDNVTTPDYTWSQSSEGNELEDNDNANTTENDLVTSAESNGTLGSEEFSASSSHEITTVFLDIEKVYSSTPVHSSSTPEPVVTDGPQTHVSTVATEVTTENGTSGFVKVYGSEEFDRETEENEMGGKRSKEEVDEEEVERIVFGGADSSKEEYKGVGRAEGEEEESRGMMESMGSVAVVAVVAAVILALIVVVVCRRGLRRRGSAKIRLPPAPDPESAGGTEMRDLDSLLPKPPENGVKIVAKSYGEPNGSVSKEETTPVLQPEPAAEEARANGAGEVNGSVQRATARLTLLPESIPKTPVFIHKPYPDD